MVHVSLDVREVCCAGAAVHRRAVIEVAHTPVLSHHGVRPSPGNIPLRTSLPGLTYGGNERLGQQLAVFGDGHVVGAACPGGIGVVRVPLQARVVAPKRVPCGCEWH